MMKKELKRQFPDTKRDHEYSDSGGRKFGRMLWLLLLMLVNSVAVGAQDYSINADKIKFTNNLNNGGYIDVEIPIHNSGGNDQWVESVYGDGNRQSYISLNGLGDEDKVVHINSSKEEFPNQIFKLYSKKGRGPAAYVKVHHKDVEWREVTTTEVTTEHEQKMNVLTCATYRIYPLRTLLESKDGIEVTVHLSVGRTAASSREVHKVSDTFTFNLPAAPKLTAGPSDNPGKMKVSFNGKKGDMYKITDFDKFFDIIADGMVEVEYSVQDTERKVELTYLTKISEHQSVATSTSTTIPGYQFPRSLSAEMTSGGDVTLKWEIAAVTSGNVYEGDYFELQRSDNKDFNNALSIGEVEFKRDKLNYEFLDKTSEENLNGTYYYRVRRTKFTGWNWGYVRDTNLEVSMKHRFVKSAEATVIDGSRVKITWEYDNGEVWSEKSNIILTLTNESKATVTTVTVPADSIDGRSYTDKLLTTCDVYSYKIHVKPANSKYKEQEPIKVESEGPIYTVNMGTIQTVDASKGYYSDQVELEWATDGNPVDVFSIRAREYKSGAEFKQIDQVGGNVASDSYQYSDKKAIPGVIYEYQVVAITSCGGENVMKASPTVIGFRTPTGNIYGRVTYENGQAVQGAEVRAEISEGAGIKGKSYRFDGNSALTVTNNSLLEENTEAITLQAWVKTANESGTIVDKSSMYSLRIEEGKALFSVQGNGTEYKVSSKKKLSDYRESGEYVHLTGVFNGDSLFIYVNGDEVGQVKFEGNVTGTKSSVTIGIGFTGCIDEVRIWGKALDAQTIARDYTRYLTGGETDLLAYYTFDYSVDDSFYDISYAGTKYNGNHGKVSGAVSVDDIPTANQLGYKGYTESDGSYTILAIPYAGNGTTYMIIPRLGTHKFESQKELRLISGNSQSHTVNFTDKSSFAVSGKVTYKGGTIPVEGVSFKIDGITAMDGKANVIRTDARGMFSINVPVGTHEVRAEKLNHVFVGNGRITNSDGTDRNYQDIVTGIELEDSTTIRYIGRVAGGVIQENYPLGHSLSKNNLGDSIKVELKYENDAYQLTTKNDSTVTMEHFLPSNWSDYSSVKKNDVKFSGNTITIYPNAETGEFVADVLPEKYKVTVTVPGHSDTPLPGSGEELNLTNSFTKEISARTYIDSLTVPGEYTEYSDTVFYNKGQLFIKRYTPVVHVAQLDGMNKELPYFGEESVAVNTLLQDNSYEAPLYDKATGKYTLGMPVFEQGKKMKFGVRVYEEYKYKDENGKDKDGVEPNKVPTQDARITFGSELPANTPEELAVDSLGYVEYAFQVGNPELTNGIRNVTAKMVYGDSNNPTSVNWEGHFNAAVLGVHMQGTNFITGGPDEIMFVLRDPPGSNSYAYLEKGVTRSKTSTYSGNVVNVGSEIAQTKAGTKTITFAGLGAGTIIENDFHNEIGLGVTHQEQVGGVNSTQQVTTTTTRFQTSADPAYVGADGDVYVGYSTNVTLGKTDNINIIPKEMYDANPGDYEVYERITPTTSPWLLVKTTGIGVSQKFGTLFAYPQVHIEQVLLPQMEDFRNSLLHQSTEGIDFQALANQQKSAVYVSKLTPDDPNYGKSNSDPAFPHPDNEDIYDGSSYKIYFPEGDIMQNDTIMTLNQSMENWVKHLKANEADKVKADLLQNYSYQAGSSVEYSESYSHTSTATTNFSIAVGMKVASDIGVTLNASTGFILKIEEDVSTEHGGEFTTEEEANHCKGFVLADSGTDYLSVDVCRPKGFLEDDQYINYEDMKEGEPKLSTFIFKTKGGATSCPYEAGYQTKYYQPGMHTIDEPTVQIEVPEISVADDFIENVPSGKPAYVTLYIRNNSESQDDNWFNLKMMDTSNPNGAQLIMDGAPIGNGRALLVAAGETLVKTLEVRKGAAMNYDDLKLTLESQCQCDPTDLVPDIADTVTFTVHFTPSATDVNIKKPANNWTYNTKLPTEDVNGIQKHYMEVILDGFDVNYDNFRRIKLQYKPSSASDEDWSTLMSYYKDADAYDQAVTNGQNAEMIKAEDGGTIKYKWHLDDLRDQRYDLRAVGTSMINNEEIENISAVHSGIKDMYNPRLFGSAQPANGILTITDEIRLNFNETIAEGYLTDNNFEVTGIRNGAQTDHSVSIRLDGVNDRLTSQFERNWANKDLTVEMWILPDKSQDAVLFSHGNANEALEVGLTADNRLKVKVGTAEITSDKPVAYEQGVWAHVALVLDKTGYVTAYYNFVEYISNRETGVYNGEGIYTFGAGVNGAGNFAGKMHNARIWDKVLTSGRIQTNSLNLLSGAESNLLAYYPMNEAKGAVLKDKARGANLDMNGSEWALPEGRATAFNGEDQYVRLSTGSSAVVDYSMDYTIEFWFKGEPGQTNATLAANGKGDGTDFGGSRDLFFLGFEDGVLTFRNNEVKVTTDGDYLDNNWHHLALAVSRTAGRGQIIIDGTLKSYFESQDLGGVSAAYLFLGARGWTSQEDITAIKVDNFFKGEIDDFRMWDLYKNETLVANGNSERLDGTEKGLLAYYPFEHYIDWQGTKELQFTLKDMKVQTDPAQAVPDAKAFGNGSVETDMTAPVKDKGPVSKLLYDFVVNNDALIITMNEAWERIEKTIVTFTVDGVRDVNGNEIVNPVTWSAYIDRNQLKWSESEVSIEKPVYEMKKFTVKAVNKGGSVQHFTIENMPEWLTVEPESGTINPSSSLDITFTIDEGLNIGSYNEVVYMRNDNNVVEALPLDIKVNGEKPDWSVNPKDFKYSMNVYGKMRIDNIFSADEEDMLAAFSNGKCVGVTNNQYLKVNDMWYAFLTVYNNENRTDNLEFRMWDASTGKIYMAMPAEPISFESDAVKGSAANPVIFDGKELIIQNIPVEDGWNWISFNVQSNALSSVQDVLTNNRWTNDDLVKDETNGVFVSYLAGKGKWVGSMAESGFDNKHMYLVKSSEAQTISLTGTPIKNREDLTLDIRQGWNYISYLPTVNLSLKEALAGFEASEGDIVKGQNSFAMYGGNLGWLGDLTYMEPGRGYMLQSSKAVTLTYPNVNGSAANKVKTRAASDVPVYQNNRFASNMTIVATVKGNFDNEVTDRIRAYAGGELRGIAQGIKNPLNDSILYFLTIKGELQEPVSFTLERNGEIIGQTDAEFDYNENEVKGSVRTPYMLSFMKESGGHVYPNPFVNELNVSMAVDEEATVEISISDVSGRIVEHFNTSRNGGYVNVTLKNLDKLASGIYLLNVKVDGENHIYKVEKK